MNGQPHIEQRIDQLVAHYTQAYYMTGSPPNPLSFMKELMEVVNILRGPRD